MSRKKRRRIEKEEENKEAIKTQLTIQPRTENQRKYHHSILNNKMTICIGPAGTGKTLLATRCGLDSLLKGTHKRLLLTRPLVCAEGNDPGALPGDIVAKIGPFLRPITDEIISKTGRGFLEKMIESLSIEFLPLAYMRGRNFHNCFVIADEMQNAKYSELLLLLTRYGRNCNMIINGDPSQTDLRIDQQGGLVKIFDKLKPVSDIGLVELTKSDILREPLVAQILRAIENPA